MTNLHQYRTQTLITEPAPGLPEHIVLILGEDCEYQDMRGISCDVVGCFEPNYIDIITNMSHELRPIYLDTTEEVRICRECLGKWLAEGLE